GLPVSCALAMAATFADLGLSETTLQALRDVGYEAPSPIQEQAIPALLEGRDVIGQAQTGTGKTAAFGLPIMQYIDPSERSVQALVLTPTRELCIQVTQALRTYGAHAGVDVVAVFGGAPIRTLADRYMYDPEIIQVEAATLTIDTVAQFQLPVDAKSKPDKLVEVLRDEAPDQAIVFVRTKIRCEQLFRTLRDRGMNVRALHGDMSQGSRDGVMLAFKGGRIPVLVATDVAARGLDISTVTHVINYEVPTSPA